MIKRILYAILAVIFAFVGFAYVSMGDNVTGGSAILLFIICAFWAIRKNRNR